MSLYERLCKRFGPHVISLKLEPGFIIMKLSSDHQVESLETKIPLRPFLLRVRLRIAMRRLFRSHKKLNLFIKNNNLPKI